MDTLVGNKLLIFPKSPLYYSSVSIYTLQCFIYNNEGPCRDVLECKCPPVIDKIYYSVIFDHSLARKKALGLTKMEPPSREGKRQYKVSSKWAKCGRTQEK